MSGWIASHYEVFRALHLIAVIAWMAGLMYLPRLFVYHSLAPLGGELDQQLIIMERRLHRGIMIPAMIVVCFDDCRCLYGCPRAFFLTTHLDRDCVNRHVIASSQSRLSVWHLLTAAAVLAKTAFTKDILRP